MISQQTINDIFNTARVEEVIGDFVQLKRAGSNLKGLSPFSDEKTPSFMVSPAKQIWKDFSSGKGGNVVTFLMEHEHFTYPEALRWLAKKYNIEIEEEREQTDEEKEEIKTKESLFIISEFAKKFFINQLKETEEGKNIGLSYFKERGFKNETIDNFELGYSPQKWDAFASYAKEKGYSQKILEDSGLVIYKEDGNSFDRFRERVIFPIHSFSGRVLGFGGRTLKRDAKIAKYLNSPESEIYHKSKILYGIFQAKQEIIKKNECLLVEGYTDVLSLYQSGIKNVVASSGTALTPEQVRLIKRLTPNIIIVFDGDSAGIKASFRGIDLILEQELNVKTLLLPDGEDPDSFAQKYAANEIQTYIEENSTDFIRFKTNVLWNDAKDDPVKKAELIRDIVQSISLIPNLIQREIYIQETAKLMNINEETLFNELSQILSRKNRETRRSTSLESKMKVVTEEPQKLAVDAGAFIEEEIIKLIMQYGDLIIEMKDDDKNEYETTVIEEIIKQFEENDLELKNEMYQNILEDVKLGYNQGELRSGNFFLRLVDEEKNSIASEKMMEKYTLSKNWKEKHGIYIKSEESMISKKVSDVILRHKSFYLEGVIKDFSSILESEEITGEARREQLKKITKLIKMRAEIHKALNRII